ncbi:hypothetical protein [Natrinema salsiterrestre]|uniref:Uncharacterized protein n=1 Tax=Natrinema salsiterrestre TaxID=2950540 RepID=A0A9Q4L975_9EURY|nr:hypothetical protein [Natrinema salsiterrestre]MDF9747611.1 hypothetical protein [Natrinema salsiterrestre]
MMDQNTDADDDGRTEQQTDATQHEFIAEDYITDPKVAVDPAVVRKGGTQYQPNAEYLVVGTDRYRGNVLRGMLVDLDEGVCAYATRRDDYYNEDGTRSAWNIRDAGEIQVTDVAHRVEYRAIPEKEHADEIEDLHEWFECDPEHVIEVTEQALLEGGVSDVTSRYIEIPDHLHEFRVYYTLSGGE